jgi:hypothetical protein
MLTNIQVANSALLDINVDTIMSFDDPSKEARVVNSKFQKVLDQVLSINPWNCNRSFISLNRASDTEKYGWDYVYTIPNNCLYIRAIVPYDSLSEITPETLKRLNENSLSQASDSTYSLANGKIYSNATNIILVYSKQITDCTKIPTYVLTPIIKLLAAEIAYPITQDRQVRADNLGMYDAELRSARAANAREVNLPVPIASILTVRT